MADLDEVIIKNKVQLSDLLERAQDEHCVNEPTSVGEQLSEHDSDGQITEFMDQYLDREGQPTGRYRKNKNNLYIILRRDRRWQCV